MDKIGGLLMNLGGPERITDVGPFLYNLFSENIKEQIISNKNSLILKENSELTILNYIDTNSKNNFFVNSFDYIKLNKGSNLKNFLFLVIFLKF